MSAIQKEVTEAVRAATAPLVNEITQLRRLVEKMQHADEPEWVTVKRAAEILKCTEKTVHRHCEQGRFEVRRDGRRKLIRYASLIEAAG